MRSIFVGLVCLLVAGCEAQEIERVEASSMVMNNLASNEEPVCLSCDVLTEEVIAGEEYTCWLESRNNEKDMIFDLSSVDNPSTVDDPKRFLIPKGEMLCENEGKKRLYPSGTEIQPVKE